MAGGDVGTDVASADDGTADDGTADTACDAEPVLRTTDAGIEFVRTPQECFADLQDWPYQPQYVELDGLRQAYVDEGPPDGPVVLLLHGQPSWSYLYRKMIPVFVEAGYRTIAMDHLGMGRSDKPTDIGDYSYLGHYDRLLRFIEALDLRDINVFVQDWGSLIGLRVVGLNPDRFATVTVGDGALPVVPAGVEPYPPVENPNEIEALSVAFEQIPAQQTAFYDGCEPLAGAQDDGFAEWMRFAMKAESFKPSRIVEALTWFDLSEDVEHAYDAPFPSRIYMAGPRVFPSLVNEVPGQNDEAWAGLTAFDRPFLTLWAANDPGSLGSCEAQWLLVDNVVGAAALPHHRFAEASHFLQDDQGQAIATRMVAALNAERKPSTGRASRYCEILLVQTSPTGPQAEVWGTPGLNDCPAAQWEALDADAIQAETGATAVIMNGPRYFLMNSSYSLVTPSIEQRTFGELAMRRLATVDVDPAQAGGSYIEAAVERTTTFIFNQGEEIYELTSDNADVYVMQSWSQIVDPDLVEADLADLSARLALPAGWTYQARTLGEDLVLRTDGTATVVQDELKNTYQKITSTDGDPQLPISGDGTGTPCTTDADCAGLTASHCLVGSQQSFCTVEGCTSGMCGDSYLCCHSCNAAAAPLLPFEESACVPAGGVTLLTGQAGCTCD